MQRTAALAFILAGLATSAAQDIIAADQGGESSTQSVAKGQPVYGTKIDAGTYQQNMYTYSGGGESTMWVLMATVSLGYTFLFFVLSASCFWGRQVQQVPFQRFPDTEDPMYPQYQHKVVADLDDMWRKAFVGKVYTLLALQLLLTIAITASMMVLGGYGFYIWVLTDGAWTRMVAFIGTFALVISMFCYKQSFPLNLILLFSFTACMAYTIGVVCTAYAATGMTLVVIEAFAITSLLFIGLTAFTMLSGIDFSFLGLVLPMVLFSFIIWGFFAMFAFPSFMFSQVYSLMGALIFSLYVLYDTYSITTLLTYDDYVLGAINLYLDFINLFLFILQCLAGARND